MAKLERIIWHWSAGGYTPGNSERDHYHFFIDGDGDVQAGDYAPEDNLDTADGAYAAHVKGFNTGSIGIAVCAMAEASESPFNAGECPIRPVQLRALLLKTVDLCKQYQITIGRETTLSHAEVQPSCGKPQDGKWDISWLPGMQSAADPVMVGDLLRSLVAVAAAGAGLPDLGGATAPPISPNEDVGDGDEVPPKSLHNDLEPRLARLEAWANSYA